MVEKKITEIVKEYKNGELAKVTETIKEYEGKELIKELISEKIMERDGEDIRSPRSAHTEGYYTRSTSYASH